MRRTVYSDDPTAKFDEQGFALREYYDANCPELHLGGLRGWLKRIVRRILFGYRDYDLDRDRHNFMLGLLNESRQIFIESGDMEDCCGKHQ